MARKILFNSKQGNYTLQKEVGGVESFRRVPIKFKLEDSTAKFRREILEKEINSDYENFESEE